MQEKWIRWEAANIAAKKYHIESITETIEETIKIKLSDSANKEIIYVSFPEGIDTYRRTNESYTLDTIHYLEKTYGRDFYAQWSFFKIENSEYLQWLSEKSHGTSDDYQLMHFCILGLNSIMDIACISDPIISIETISTDQEITEKSNTKTKTLNSEKTNIENDTIGKKGVLDDGRLVSVRKYSHDGSAMMEIFDPKDKQRIKIRYKNNAN